MSTHHHFEEHGGHDYRVDRSQGYQVRRSGDSLGRPFVISEGTPVKALF